MKLKVISLISVLLVSATVNTVHAADIVGIDISSTAYNGSGVLSTASRGWESATSTGDSFTIGTQQVFIVFNGAEEGSINAEIDLFDNYKHNGGSGSIEMILTNLNANESYDIALFGAQNAFGGRGALFDPTHPDLPAKETTGDQQTNFVEGVNYVLYEGVVPDNSQGDARIRILASNGSENIAVFNGFEVRRNKPSREYDYVVNADAPSGGSRLLYEGPGVLSDSGTYWNHISHSASNLSDSMTNTTSVGMTLSASQGLVDRGAASQVNELTRDFIYDSRDGPNGSTVELTLTINGLITNRKYDLALFGIDSHSLGDGRGATFTIAGYDSKSTTADKSTLADDYKFSEWDTHVIFQDVLPGANGEITVTITPEPGITDICIFNGFQLGRRPVEITGTIIMVN